MDTDIPYRDSEKVEDLKGRLKEVIYKVEIKLGMEVHVYNPSTQSEVKTNHRFKLILGNLVI